MQDVGNQRPKNKCPRTSESQCRFCCLCFVLLSFLFVFLGVYRPKDSFFDSYTAPLDKKNDLLTSVWQGFVRLLDSFGEVLGRLLKGFGEVFGTCSGGIGDVFGEVLGRCLEGITLKNLLQPISTLFRYKNHFFVGGSCRKISEGVWTASTPTALWANLTPM